MEQFPPAGFVPTESAVEGVTVYMPAQDAEAHQQVLAFHCPQCGGETAFNAADGGITCTYCAYHEAPEQTAVGTQAESFEFKLSTIEQASHGWGVERKEIMCEKCGTHIAVNPDTLTASCTFCLSNKVVQHKAPQDVLRPRFLIPFKIDDSACHASVRKWLGTNAFVPSTLKQLASVGEFTPLYMPYWLFEADAHTTWKALVGKKTNNNNIRWRWENGEFNRRFNNVQVRGSTKIQPSLLKDVEEFNIDDLTPYDAQYLAGKQAVAYEKGLEEAWSQARQTIRTRMRKAGEQHTSTRRQRNFSASVDFQDESWRYILQPFYLATYAYNNKTYQVVVNGQTGAVAGQRPADWRKIALLAAIPLLLGTLLMLYQWFAGISDSNLINVAAAGLFILGVILAITLGLKGAQLQNE